MSVTIIFVGIFGVLAGWHWQRMNHSWRNLRSTAAQAKGKLPALREARMRHTGTALWYVVAAILVIAVIAKLH